MRANGQNAQVVIWFNQFWWMIFLFLNKLESLTFYSKLMINETIIDECGSESKKTRRILCKNEATLEIVDDHLCGDQRAKPPEEEACEGKPCTVSLVGNLNHRIM